MPPRRDRAAPASARWAASASVGEAASTAPAPALPWRILLALLVAAAIVRFVGLTIYPALEADEGLWTNCSKNFVAFGDWFMDGRTHVVLAPVFHALSVALFTLTGPSIGAVRALSALAGALAVPVLYLLVLRVTRQPRTALGAAVLFGFSHWTIAVSRKAMVEPLQLCLILVGALVLLGPRRWWRTPAAGVVFALVLLTKLNAAIVLLAFAATLLLPATADDAPRDPRRLGRAALLLGVALGLAGAVYGAVYLATPEHFVRAFAFELDGAHFQSRANPLVQVGRFALDPVLASNTVFALFRQVPFLMVLAVVGLPVGLFARSREAAPFGLWAGFTVVFFLLQLFQPIRYFLLALPALAFFGALTLDRLAAPAAGDRAGRWIWGTALGLYVLFNLSRVGVSMVVNRDTRLQTVVAWAAAHTEPTDRIMAAGYFCTDLPHRAYAYYHFARDPADLVANVHALDIDYVIYDSGEWRQELGDTLAAHFTPVMQWPFGVVYRVAPLTPASAEAGQAPRAIGATDAG